MTTAQSDDATVDVRPGETPAERCPYCERPFRTERLYALHLGERHPEQCTEAQAAAYEDAREAEDDELFIYHLKVTAALVILFFAFAYAYAFVWMG